MINIEYAKISMNEINYIKIPVTLIKPSEDIKAAQEVLDYFKSNYKEEEFIRTRSGAIKKCYQNMYYKYETKSENRYSLEILAHTEQGWCRVQFREVAQIVKDKPIYGTNSLRELMQNIPELEQWVSKNEEENKIWKDKAKKFYNSQLVDMEEAFIGIPSESEQYNGKNLEHVWSLDISWAFPSALTDIIPSSYEYINDLFVKRKEHPEIKAMGVTAIGAMASESTSRIKGCGSKMALSKLRYQILKRHNEKIQKVREEIEAQGGIVLNMRIDSIKFIWTKARAPKISCEGNGLGKAHWEFKNSTYRQFSTGSYEYIDNEGKVIVKLNGKTKLDAVKDRKDWEWDDILTKEAQTIIGWSYNNLTKTIEEQEVR